MTGVDRRLGDMDMVNRISPDPRPWRLAFLTALMTSAAATPGFAAAVVSDGPAVEEVIVTAHRVACDGVGGALGHPRVYIELGPDGVGECGYCDRRFVLAGSKKAKHGAPGVYEPGGGH